MSHFVYFLLRFSCAVFVVVVVDEDAVDAVVVGDDDTHVVLLLSPIYLRLVQLIFLLALSSSFRFHIFLHQVALYARA